MTVSDSRLHLGQTESVCPDCLVRLPAERFAEGDTVYLEKTCPDHGTFSTPVWRGLQTYFRWGRTARAYSRPPVCAAEVRSGCPLDCGLCPDHRQQSCCVLLEVTSRCDIACPVCFAGAGRQGTDASLADIDGWLDTLAEAGGRVHIQLSGGEPTVRDDLPEIIARIRSKGFGFVQLNTNGIRLASDPAYLRAIVDAGLDCVFLQFRWRERRCASATSRRHAHAREGESHPQLRRGRRWRGARADARSRRQYASDRRHRRIRQVRNAGGTRGALPARELFRPGAESPYRRGPHHASRGDGSACRA